MSGGNIVPSITQAEHIGPDDTGDNIEAKRVALYAWNPSLGDNGEWQRVGSSPTANVDYDYIDIDQTSSTVETYTFKSGGSGGVTVQTIVVTYTSSAKTDLASVEYS